MKRQKVRKFLLLVSGVLFPVTLYYLSPVIILAGASRGIVTGSMIFFGALFLASLFLGRAFCGWLCPVGGLHEACFAVQNKRVVQGNWIKYVIWVPWLAAIALLGLIAGGLTKVMPFYFTNHGISVTDTPGYIALYSVVAFVLVLALAVGKRSFCHHVCWMAPFMVIGTKIKERLGFPALHLEASPDCCIDCKKCSGQCPMSLEVDQMVKRGRMADSECILCGECVDSCPPKSVTLHFMTVKKIS